LEGGQSWLRAELPAPQNQTDPLPATGIPSDECVVTCKFAYVDVRLRRTAMRRGQAYGQAERGAQTAAPAG